MTDKKKFQEKANQLFAKHPEIDKIFISENGQCFSDAKAAQDYHDLRGFEKEPEIFFREGFEDRDDSDVQEALQHSEQARKILTAVLQEVAAVCDLDQDYQPAGRDTDETLTAVISLREKYAEKDRLLTEANLELEKLSNIEEDNKNLQLQLEAANQQMELSTSANPTKTRKNASQTDRTET